ncbi:hypothetical protein ACOBQJ_04300 [Pelotomaculum propionicicum]|uniref:hypothetical protein n=1 Tax=Pelotomaculum propionicicum TaxID=258475 RepID=UPI003B81BCE1
MEMMAVGLFLFAFVMLLLCLYLSVWAVPAAPGKHVFNAADSSVKEEQKFIVVKLPESCKVPEDYTLDLKITLHKGKDAGGGAKSDLYGRWYKNRHHKLDEYM